MKRKLLLAAAIAFAAAFIIFPKAAPSKLTDNIAEEWYVDLSGVIGIDPEELVDMALGMPIEEKHALLKSYGAVITKIEPEGHAEHNESEYTEYGLKWAAGMEGAVSLEQIELMKKARNFQELHLPEEWYVDLSGVIGIDHDELVDMALGMPLEEKHALLKSYGAVITRIAPD